MKINNIEVVGKSVAFDGCHKIYILEDEKDIKEATESEYKIYSISSLKDIYEYSCDLRFISNWKLNKQYVKQFEDAFFES